MSVALAGVAFATFAQAQQLPTNPVVAHYRAYVEALQRDDLETAQTEAEAALTASQARDGDGGGTAVLAFNLAQLRLHRVRMLDAHAPAVLALTLAQANPASGVDPLAARLLVGESEFGDRWPEGRDLVLAALAEAQGRTDIEPVAYEAARTLANWADGVGDYEAEKSAWTAAILHANGAGDDPRVARADAKTSLAATIILESRRLQPSAAAQAADLLLEARTELWPLAQMQGAGDGLTVAQKAFGRALAWSTRVRDPNPEDQTERDALEQNETTGTTPLCRVSTRMPSGQTMSTYYPRQALARGVEGIVVLRVIYGPDGQAASAQVAAAADYDQTFTEQASALAARFRVVRLDRQPANCVMPHARFYPVHFVFSR